MESLLYSLIMKEVIRRKTLIGSQEHNHQYQRKRHCISSSFLGSYPLVMGVALLRPSSMVTYVNLGFFYYYNWYIWGSFWYIIRSTTDGEIPDICEKLSVKNIHCRGRMSNVWEKNFTLVYLLMFLIPWKAKFQLWIIAHLTENFMNKVFVICLCSVTWSFIFWLSLE